MKVFRAVRLMLYAFLTGFLVLKVKESFEKLHAAELTSSQDMVDSIGPLNVCVRIRTDMPFQLQVHRLTVQYPSITFCRYMDGIRPPEYKKPWVRHVLWKKKSYALTREL